MTDTSRVKPKDHCVSSVVTMEERAASKEDDSEATPSPQSAAGETSAAPAKTAAIPPVPSSPSPQKVSHADTRKAATTASVTPKASNTLEDANEELSKLVRSGKASSSDVPGIKAILKEHVSLKDKVDKLKSLLGRSAKAQRETKVDSDATQKRLSQALREIERLNQKLEKLQSRPTHRKSIICG
jgi:hypothetical protein